jgi:hypothetical protein
VKRVWGPKNLPKEPRSRRRFFRSPNTFYLGFTFLMDANTSEYFYNYHTSSYIFCGNYSFLNLETQRSQYIRPKVTVHKGAETIQGRKLIKGRNYMRKYGI